MSLRSLMLAGAAIASLGIGGHAVQAAPCPTLTTDPSGLAGHCNLIVTFNADGSVTTTADKGTNYDGSDDALVGVVNNSGTAISAFGIAGANIFGFDGDGVDRYITIANNAQDTSGYGGANGYFTGIVGNSGTVDFITAIASGGGTSYFSLEAPFNIAAPPTITPVNPVPEPISIALLGSGLLGLGFVKLRRS